MRNLNNKIVLLNIMMVYNKLDFHYLQKMPIQFTFFYRLIVDQTKINKCLIINQKSNIKVHIKS